MIRTWASWDLIKTWCTNKYAKFWEFSRFQNIFCQEFKIYKAWINPNLPAIATLKLGSPQVWPLREKAGCPTQLLFNCLKFCRNHPFQVKIYSFTEFAVVTDCFVGECIMCQIMYKWILNKWEYHWLARHLLAKLAQDISFFSIFLFFQTLYLLRSFYS